MTDIQNIPLKKLDLSERNVRKTGGDDDLGDLIASIEAHGLLQSLVVQEGKRGRFAVIAGGRRLRALLALAEAGRIPASHEVPCRVIPGEADASELSLAENIIRAPMHPADQFEAFAAVIDQGKSVADVAARFNVSEQIVTQRLKLGRLSPAILAAYREEVIGLEEAQAFTLSDDHAEQERVFAELGHHCRNAWNIRQALTETEVCVTDRRARCIGLEVYIAAGGTVRRDLFQTRENGYLQDVALVDRLVREKLAAEAKAVKAEGWQFVEVMPDADYAALAKYERQYPKRQSVPNKLKKKIAKLEEQSEAITNEVDDLDDLTEAQQEKLAALEQQIEKLTPAPSWPAKTLATCGAIIRLDHDGSVEVERGLKPSDLVRKEKQKAKEAEAKKNGAPETASFSAKLVEDMTASKSAALRAELMRQPDIALAGMVHALGIELWYRGLRGESCLAIRATSSNLKIAGKAMEALDAERALWGERLPEDAADFFGWCLGQSRDTLVELLAYFAGFTVDAVQTKHLKPGSGKLQHANQLAAALKLDMGQWYAPTAENFFGRISRKAILSLVDEAKGAPQGPGLEKLNKTDLAARAALIVEGTGWLPAPLRIAGNDNQAAHLQAAE